MISWVLVLLVTLPQVGPTPLQLELKNKAFQTRSECEQVASTVASSAASLPVAITAQCTLRVPTK